MSGTTQDFVVPLFYNAPGKEGHVSEEKQKEVARVDRYLLFVGCANSECDLDFHDHLVGMRVVARKVKDETLH